MHPFSPTIHFIRIAELQTKGRHHERLDDSRGARRNVRNRLGREQHHRHWLGLQRPGHRQHGPRPDQGRICRGAPRREQAEGRDQRWAGIPFRPFHGAGVDRRHVRPRRTPLPYRHHFRPLLTRAGARRHNLHARRHLEQNCSTQRALAVFQELARRHSDHFRHFGRGNGRPGIGSRPQATGDGRQARLQPRRASPRFQRRLLQ